MALSAPAGAGVRSLCLMRVRCANNFSRPPNCIVQKCAATFGATSFKKAGDVGHGCGRATFFGEALMPILDVVISLAALIVVPLGTLLLRRGPVLGIGGLAVDNQEILARPGRRPRGAKRATLLRTHSLLGQRASCRNRPRPFRVWRTVPCAWWWRTRA